VAKEDPTRPHPIITTCTRFNLHPYSIAKIAGHSTVEFYRQTYGLPFSNGVIFTTESGLKSKEFLLNKVAAHIKEWKNEDKTPLKVGNLDSFRNILHAFDVANAIHIILSKPNGDTYLICNSESHNVYDLVMKLYLLSGIEVSKTENSLTEKNSGLQILLIDDKHFRRDLVPINIRGEAIKLKALGWKPTFSVEDILNELNV
jgi:GDP-D-mannose dehydratase